MRKQPITVTDDRGHMIEVSDATEGNEPAVRLTIDYQATITLSIPAMKAITAYADAVRSAAFDQSLLD